MKTLILFVLLRCIQPVNNNIEHLFQIQSQKERLRQVTSEEILEYRDDEDVRHVYLFSNPYCRWCEESEKELLALSKEMPDVEFYKINCLIEKEYCKKMKIHSTPTIYVFKNYIERKCYDRNPTYLKQFIMKI